MNQNIQKFWPLLGVGFCYMGSLVMMMFGDMDGGEKAPSWALRVMHWPFAAIFFVALQQVLNAKKNQGQPPEE